jgi:hypothetical protein
MIDAQYNNWSFLKEQLWRLSLVRVLVPATKLPGNWSSRARCSLSVGNVSGVEVTRGQPDTFAGFCRDAIIIKV